MDFGSANGGRHTELGGVLNSNQNSNQDLNVELLAGPTSNSVTTPVVTLLLRQTFSTSVSSLGSIQPALGDITSSGGDIMDLSGNAYNVPASNQWYQVLAWAGN